MQSNTSTRKFVIGAVAGIALAGALGAAFILGGGRGESGSSRDAEAAAQVSGTVQVPGTAAAAGGTAQAQGSGTSPQAPEDSGAGADIDTSDSTEETPTDTPSATPTATGTPSGDGCNLCEDGDLVAPSTATSTPAPGCKFCVNGDIAIAPTVVNPCPLCDKPIIVANPADTTPPAIDDVHVELCEFTLFVDFAVDESSKVWLTFDYLGDQHTTPVQHVDHIVHLTADMSFDGGWGVYLMEGLVVHATDTAGNETEAGPIETPDYDIHCS